MTYPKNKTFLTDQQWRKMNYRQLLELAEDINGAKQIVEFLDKNPTIRADLSGIYIRAHDTIRRSKG